jgi:hypothetical protein
MYCFLLRGHLKNDVYETNLQQQGNLNGPMYCRKAAKIEIKQTAYKYSYRQRRVSNMVESSVDSYNINMLTVKVVTLKPNYL